MSNIATASGATVIQNERPRYHASYRRAPVVLHQSQCKIESSADSRRCRDWPICRKETILLDLDLGVEARHTFTVEPVCGSPPSVEQSRFGKDQGSGTNRAIRRVRATADRRYFTSAGVAVGGAIPPAMMIVSNLRRLNDDVCISYPREVATGPPCSETSATSYATDPRLSFAASNTVVTAKFIVEKAG
jgi:hypothetical protein